MIDTDEKEYMAFQAIVILLLALCLLLTVPAYFYNPVLFYAELAGDLDCHRRGFD